MLIFSYIIMEQNNNTNISAMSSDECLNLYNSLCKEETDPFLFISLVVNFLLLLTTGISELMASSKCKFNSLFELIIYPLRKLAVKHKEKNHQEADLDLEAGSADTK
jgi:hypothetical protein